MRRVGNRFAVLAIGTMLVCVGPVMAQNTIGGDEFAPGEADFVQSGSEVGRGAGFQFSDDFYAQFGVDAEEIRAQEALSNPDPTTPDRFGAFYRGVGDAGTGTGVASDDRFVDDTRITVHNMGFNAAGEMLFYPDPPSFFFESAFLNEETKELTNRSFVFIFPRTKNVPNPVAGCDGNLPPLDLLAPGACNRRQDNIFDTGNGYLTANPLQLWRIMFVTWDGPDVHTDACRTEMRRLARKNGRDTEGFPILATTREVLDVAGADVFAGQGADAVLLKDVLPAKGLKNPDPRDDIPGVDSREGGEICVTVHTRRQEDKFGVPASATNTLDGPPFVT